MSCRGLDAICGTPLYSRCIAGISLIACAGNGLRYKRRPPRGGNWANTQLGCTMKNERRHELQQNSLAAWIEQSINQFKPHANTITAGVVAVAALVSVYYYFSSQRASSHDKAWDQYLQAVDEQGYEALAKLGDDYPNSRVGMCAMLVAADRQLQSGVEALFHDRTAAAQDLGMALDNYTQVAEKADDPLLLQRGLIGKAYAEESLAYDSADNLRAAKATYEQYLAEFPDGIFAEQAQIRLSDLGNPATASFYDWFAAQTVGSPEATDDIPGLDSSSELDELPEGPGSSSSVLDTENDDGTTTDEAAEMEESTTNEPATEEPEAEEPEAEEPEAEEPEAEEPEAEEPATSDEPVPES